MIFHSKLLVYQRYIPMKYPMKPPFLDGFAQVQKKAHFTISFISIYIYILWFFIANCWWGLFEFVWLIHWITLNNKKHHGIHQHLKMVFFMVWIPCCFNQHKNNQWYQNDQQIPIESPWNSMKHYWVLLVPAKSGHRSRPGQSCTVECLPPLLGNAQYFCNEAGIFEGAARWRGWRGRFCVRGAKNAPVNMVVERVKRVI